MAEIVGCSRQNLRKLLLSCDSRGPSPFHEGKWTVWHLAPLLQWLSVEKRYSVSPRLLEISETTIKVNAALDASWTDSETQERCGHCLRQQVASGQHQAPCEHLGGALISGVLNVPTRGAKPGPSVAFRPTAGVWWYPWILSKPTCVPSTTRGSAAAWLRRRAMRRSPTC